MIQDAMKRYKDSEMDLQILLSEDKGLIKELMVQRKNQTSMR